MGIRSAFAVMCGKFTAKMLHIMGRGGTSLPGVVTLKLCPNVLGALAKDIKVICVTGTNGKTTTCHAITDILTANGYTCLSNEAGANMLNGVVSCFMNAASLTGKVKRDYAVLECDEASLRHITRSFGKLDVTVVVTNVFRDQLDRYGEVLTTLDLIKQGLANVPQTSLVLNADCSLTSSLAETTEHKDVTFFGVNTSFDNTSSTDISDAVYCIKCKTKYKYRSHTFGHLGDFYCENCGYHREKPFVAIEQVKEFKAASAEVVMSIDGSSYDAKITLPGAYNLYNGLAAAAIGKTIGLDDKTVISSMSKLTTPFGRMEHIPLTDKGVEMILVKNPAGFNEVISFLTAHCTGEDDILFGLNDNSADGTDVSWIWDVEFEKLSERIKEISTEKQTYYFTGKRGEDLEVRLKYAGFDTSKFQLDKDYRTLIQTLKGTGRHTYMVLSYTVMLAFRDKLGEVVELKKYAR
ncbi:MurT ligase domain-containing protein [Ruminococcus sp. NK3A76]|uniref:MurT ligase domain-containing protein n=1 Tax=Ruminococcus sp. NK3A76 TaxID=877411 RepID=UPI00048C4D88|nr:MurT ligase domain-containing protein [Ruminococcus sp. NK3A76]